MALGSKATYEEVETELKRVKMIEMRLEIDKTSKRIRDQGGDLGREPSPPDPGRARREALAAMTQAKETKLAASASQPA